MNRLLTAFAALPRSARWVVLAGAFMGVYFLVIEPLLDRANNHDAAADAIENNLRRASQLSDEDSDDGRLLATGMKTYGRPQLPSDAAAKPESVQRIVDQILEDHGVDSRTKTERNSTMTGDRARALAADGKIERYIVEVSFEATQETVAAIIADLEQAPGISAVSRVKIDRTAIGGRFGEDFGAPGAGGESAAGRVRATISAEAWVLLRARPGDSSSSGEPS